MKVSLLLLAILPFAIAESIVNLYTDASHLFGIDPSQVAEIAHELTMVLEENHTDAACEAECQKVVPHLAHSDNMTALVAEFCPLTCQTLESLTRQLNLHFVG